MRVDKGLKIAAANRKPASGKLSLTLTKLVQDELPPGSPKVRSLKDSSNENDNNIRLPFIRVSKGPSIIAANRKPASGKLLSASTKLALGIVQDMRAKKELILKTG